MSRAVWKSFSSWSSRCASESADSGWYVPFSLMSKSLEATKLWLRAKRINSATTEGGMRNSEVDEMVSGHSWPRLLLRTTSCSS